MVDDSVRGSEEDDPAGNARENEPVSCKLCYAQGDDVWGIEGHQLVLCLDCRIRWRRGLGYSDYS